MRKNQLHCLRCHGPMEQPFVALSRFDNMTLVCPQCGRDEAMYQMYYGDVPDFNFVLTGGVKTERTYS